MCPQEDPEAAAPRPWRRVAREAGPDLLIAQAHFDTLEHPRSGAHLRRLVLQVPTWVNVVARTPGGDLVLVRQYRFGSGRVTIEIPGGVVDPGEEPEETARRELLEETGYTSERWSLLGTVEPNPAFQDNLCHTFLAEGACHTHAPQLDPGEDIQVLTLSPDEVRTAVRAGEIRHSLVLCGLARLFDLRSEGRES